ncbi:rRNA binding protein [Aureococcus anophagefferens]|uniref:rRNA binding protein n=2 Tax=Aureococcus anophagefferens TaxID=44056 RepID=A0ABR1FX52_AURAN
MMLALSAARPLALRSVARPALAAAARPAPLAPPPALGATRGFASRKHKKFIKLAKGYRGRANRCFRIAVQRVEKAWQYAYRDRKVKKREMRKSWIRSINASSRAYGVPYNRFIAGMRSADIDLNRKVLADLAVNEPLSFLSVLEVTRAADPYLASRADAMRPMDGPFDGLEASDQLLFAPDDDELDDVDDVPLGGAASS